MELKRVKAKGRGLNLFFLLERPERWRATRKKRKHEGVSGGKGDGAHYACRRG